MSDDTLNPEEIRADMQAGTPGPWMDEHRDTGHGLYRTQVFPSNDPENTVCTVHWHSVATANGVRTDRAEIARRIARLPDLEQGYLDMLARIEAAEARADNAEDKLNLERALTDGAHRRAREAEALLSKVGAERDRLRLTLRNVERDLHEIQAGDLSPYEAIEPVRAALTDAQEGRDDA